MIATDPLTDAQWQIADAITRQIVLNGTDISELKKAISYFREDVHREDAGKKFFDYLKVLVRHGKTVSHSNKTVEHYKSVDAVCTQYLSDYQSDAPKMLLLLGWAERLARYYKAGVPAGEIEKPTVKSEREIEIQAVAQAYTFEVGQQLEAVITAIQGNSVTYKMPGKIRLSHNEHKLIKAGSLVIDQRVNVEIVTLKENGTPKKVRPVL